MSAETLPLHQSESPRRPDRHLKLAQAARIANVSPPTCWRWISRGINGVHLRHRRIGRKIVTTKTWLHEFFDALAKVDHERWKADSTESVETPAQRRKSIERANKELDRIGL